MTWDRSEFVLRGTDDFLRLDSLCVELLRAFYRWLQTDRGEGLAAEAAAPFAHAADRYVRDFLVDFMESGPCDQNARRVRQYVGNWYVVQTLEPTHQEIDTILHALERLYAFLGAEGLVSPEKALEFRRELADSGFFHQRLEDFWALTPEAIEPWRSVDDYRVDRPPSRIVAHSLR